MREQFLREKNIVSELEEIYTLITNLKNTLDSELHKEDSAYVFIKYEEIKKITLHGKNFKKIEEMIMYVKNNSSYDYAVALNEYLYQLKKDFIAQILLDTYINNEPKSIEVYIAYNNLTRKIDEVKKYYKLTFMKEIL